MDKEERPGVDTGGDQNFTRLKYWISLAKWFLVSVVFVAVAWIVDNGYRDRSAGILEIQRLPTPHNFG